MRISVGAILSLAVMVLLAGPAWAQQAVNGPSPAGRPDRPGEPVDQAVGDLGPRITSFRRVDPGLGAFSSRVKLYRRFKPAEWQGHESQAGASGSLNLPQSYVYEAPGVRAYVDRPRYLTRRGQQRPARGAVGNRDQRFRQLVTPNTVYDLIPSDHPASPLSQQPQKSEPVSLNGIGPSQRITGRVNTKFDARIVDPQQALKAAKARAVAAERARQRIRARRERSRAMKAAIEAQRRAERSDPNEAASPAAATQPERPATGADRSRFGPNHPINQRDANQAGE